jgi:hypothetical protein
LNEAALDQLENEQAKWLDKDMTNQ